MSHFERKQEYHTVKASVAQNARLPSIHIIAIAGLAPHVLFSLVAAALPGVTNRHNTVQVLVSLFAIFVGIPDPAISKA